MRICIYGAGAIGAWLGVQLSLVRLVKDIQLHRGLYRQPGRDDRKHGGGDKEPH